MNMSDERIENASGLHGVQGDLLAVMPPSAHGFPIFQYDPPRIGLCPFGAVTVEREVFHRIDDMDEFYKALGLDSEAKGKGLSGEEFIWDRYRRDGSKMSKACLQVQIRVFLHKHSEKFGELYGSAYDATIGKCSAVEIDRRDEHCANCPMLPIRPDRLPD